LGKLNRAQDMRLVIKLDDHVRLFVFLRRDGEDSVFAKEEKKERCGDDKTEQHSRQPPANRADSGLGQWVLHGAVPFPVISPPVRKAARSIMMKIDLSIDLQKSFVPSLH
jgi:hypothetical protein